jgi:hypothetical protein
VTAQPLCPLVLALVASEPRCAGDVAGAIARHRPAGEVPPHHAAAATLARLRGAGLVYARATADGRKLFRVTARGRRELALQRSLARAAAATTSSTLSDPDGRRWTSYAAATLLTRSSRYPP